MVLLSTFNTQPDGKKAVPSACTRIADLRLGMRMVVRWDAKDVKNEDPEWGRVYAIYLERPGVAKLIFLMDSYVDIDGPDGVLSTDKVEYWVKDNQNGRYWCVYDIEGEDIDDEEYNMEYVVGMDNGISYM